LIIKELKFWCIQAIKTKTTFFTNHWKLYPRLTNHLRSESFFVYNDTYQLSLDSNLTLL
ncbi:Carboxypeptidase vitellogenic like, partial [Aphis craccivora]